MDYITLGITGRTKLNLELLYFSCEQEKGFDMIVPPVVSTILMPVDSLRIVCLH